MKTLQKLRLINWHYFCNITTDVNHGIDVLLCIIIHHSTQHRHRIEVGDIHLRLVSRCLSLGDGHHVIEDIEQFLVVLLDD